jgi:putative glutamine amidotransferase
MKIVPGSRLARLYPGRDEATINTIHHQAVNKLGRGMIVEALSIPDSIVEAIRWRGPSYVLGVQWHPEFMFGPGIGEEHLDGSPILTEFLEAARVRKTKR